MGPSMWEVLDWRRRVHDLYRAVRSEPDPRAAHAGWAAGRRELLRTHPASPVAEATRADFAGGGVAPYDAGLRFEVAVQPAEPERRELVTGTDGVVPLERVGTVVLRGLGTLDLWWVGSYGGGLFLPLRDATSGRSTYGGGRYVLDTIKGADLGGDPESLVVDLNFAYQPSCAYDPAWACPLPGAGNTLPVPVAAGELYEPDAAPAP
jgi:uncharacterized protein